MFKLIANRFGEVSLRQDADHEPIFIYNFVDNNGKSDDCEYAFIFRDNTICLYGWHFGHDTAFIYEGNWMDNNTFPEAFHDHDYQDALVGQLRLCLKEALNNITGMITEYL